MDQRLLVRDGRVEVREGGLATSVGGEAANVAIVVEDWRRGSWRASAWREWGGGGAMLSACIKYVRWLQLTGPYSIVYRGTGEVRPELLVRLRRQQDERALARRREHGLLLPKGVEVSCCGNAMAGHGRFGRPVGVKPTRAQAAGGASVERRWSPRETWDSLVMSRPFACMFTHSTSTCTVFISCSPLNPRGEFWTDIFVKRRHVHASSSSLECGAETGARTGMPARA